MPPITTTITLHYIDFVPLYKEFVVELQKFYKELKQSRIEFSISIVHKFFLYG